MKVGKPAKGMAEPPTLQNTAGRAGELANVVAPDVEALSRRP
jgi:hypothetical protein